jgi:lipid-binding SYLF domain-containing protein
MITLKRTIFLSVFAISLSLANVVTAQTSRERSTKKAQAAAKQSAQAARVFDAIMGTREKSIPRDLLQRSEAVAVFPGVLKGGFIVGGRRGSGVISRRVKGGWSAPAVFDLTAAAWACRSARRQLTTFSCS